MMKTSIYKQDRKLRRDDVGERISTREFAPFIEVLMWVTDCRTSLKEYYILIDRISRLVSNNKWKFSFDYMKKVFTMVVRYFAGEPFIKVPEHYKGILVKADRLGLPTIIPVNLRKQIVLWSNPETMWRTRLDIICLLSFLSIYRIFPAKAVVDLSSITDEFVGVTRTFDPKQIRLAIDDIAVKIKRNAYGKVRLLDMDSAGPNSRRSTWGAEIDALAFIHQPLKLLYLSLWCCLSSSYLLLFYFFALLLLSLPYYIFSFILGGGLAELGRLSVIHKVAGKARVIGITNYWLQVIFKPLHDDIFSILKGLETDGTKDQTKPLDALIRRVGHKKETFYCFDLTAATDRLPIELQSDILDHIGYHGFLWKGLLDIDWKYKKSYVKYAVGQPMGAYSSWAMLALSHHVIIRMSALYCGFRDFKDYAVLGDDVVIANKEVADQYLINMRLLGVSINMSKSLASENLVEFAKRYRGPARGFPPKDILDITPVGPGLILQSIRKPREVYSLFHTLESLDDPILSFAQYKTRLNKIPVCLRYKVKDYLISREVSKDIFSKGYMTKEMSLNVLSIKDLYFYRPYLRQIYNPSIYENYFERNWVQKIKDGTICSQLILMCRGKIIEGWWDLVKDLKFLALKGWTETQLKTGMPFFLDIMLFPLKPAIVLYIRDLFTRRLERLSTLHCLLDEVELRWKWDSDMLASKRYIPWYSTHQEKYLGLLNTIYRSDIEGLQKRFGQEFSVGESRLLRFYKADCKLLKSFIVPKRRSEMRKIVRKGSKKKMK